MFYNTDTPRLSFTIVLSIHSSLRITRPGAGVRSRINFQGIFGILWNTGGASVPLQCFTLLVSLWPSPPFGYAGFQFNFERPWWWMWTVMRKMIHPSKYEAIKTSEKEKVSLHFSSKANVKGKLNKKGGGANLICFIYHLWFPSEDIFAEYIDILCTSFPQPIWTCHTTRLSDWTKVFEMMMIRFAQFGHGAKKVKRPKVISACQARHKLGLSDK